MEVEGDFLIFAERPRAAGARGRRPGFKARSLTGEQNAACRGEFDGGTHAGNTTADNEEVDFFVAFDYHPTSIIPAAGADRNGPIHSVQFNQLAAHLINCRLHATVEGALQAFRV